MSETKIRRISVLPTDDEPPSPGAPPGTPPVPLPQMPKEEEGKAEDTSSATNLAPETIVKPTDDPASGPGDDAMTVPRTIGLLGATSFIVGTIIGSGIFITPKGVAIYSGSVGLTLFSWTMCGTISMLAALCYAEMASVVRASGADYAYLHAAYGSWLSFVFCWCWTVIMSSQITTLALTFSEYILSSLFADGCGTAPVIIGKTLAIAVLLLLISINVYSNELATHIQIIFTFAKLFALSIIIIGGFVMLGQGHTEHLRTGFNNTPTNPGTIATAFLRGMFAYDSWNAANFIAEEIINPERNLPLSIMIALPLCIIVYLLTNISYFSVMSMTELIASETVANTWAEKVIPSVSWMIPIFVALSAFGSANGTLFTSARMLYVTGRNGQMPAVLGMVNVDSYTLSPACIVLITLSVIITLVSDIDRLLGFISFLQWIFYGMNMLSVIIFRYRPEYKDLPRPFRIPLVVPIFVFLFAIFIVVAPLIEDPQWGNLIAGAFIAIGYMFYVPFIVFRLELPCMKKVTLFCQLYLRVAKTKQAID